MKTIQNILKGNDEHAKVDQGIQWKTTVSVAYMDVQACAVTDP